MGMRLWTGQMFFGDILYFEIEGIWLEMARGGRPKLTWTEVNIAAVANLVKNDC